MGLKNAPELVADLANDFDFFVSESCFSFEECGAYDTVSASKPVLGVQYCDAGEVSEGPGAQGSQCTWGRRVV